MPKKASSLAGSKNKFPDLVDCAEESGQLWLLLSKFELADLVGQFPDIVHVADIGSGATHPSGVNAGGAINGWNAFAMCAESLPADDGNGHYWIAGSVDDYASVAPIRRVNADPTCEEGIVKSWTVKVCGWMKMLTCLETIKEILRREKWQPSKLCGFLEVTDSPKFNVNPTGGAATFSKSHKGETDDGMISVCSQHLLEGQDVPSTGFENLLVTLGTGQPRENNANYTCLKITPNCGSKIKKTRLLINDFDLASGEAISCLTAGATWTTTGGAGMVYDPIADRWDSTGNNTAGYFEWDGYIKEICFWEHRHANQVSGVSYSLEFDYCAAVCVYENCYDLSMRKYLNPKTGVELPSTANVIIDACAIPLSADNACPLPIDCPPIQDAARPAGSEGWDQNYTPERLTASPGMLSKVNAVADNGWDNPAVDEKPMKGDFRLEFCLDSFPERSLLMIGVTTSPRFPQTFSDMEAIFYLINYANDRFRYQTRGYRPTLPVVDSGITAPGYDNTDECFILQRVGTSIDWIRRLADGTETVVRTEEFGCAPVYAKVSAYKSAYWNADWNVSVNYV